MIRVRKLQTCTISRAQCWLDELINIIISRTSFDLYGVGIVATAAKWRGTTDLSDDHSICQLWVTTIEPQWAIGSTHVITNTWFWHLGILSIVEKPVPSIPIHIIITSCRWFIRSIVDGPPRLFQTGVADAGVNARWGDSNWYEREDA